MHRRKNGEIDAGRSDPYASQATRNQNKTQVHTPHIGLGGEPVEGKSLWCRPFDGKFSTSMGRVRVVLHQARQTKIGNFD